MYSRYSTQDFKFHIDRLYQDLELAGDQLNIEASEVISNKIREVKYYQKLMYAREEVKFKWGI